MRNLFYILIVFSFIFSESGSKVLASDGDIGDTFGKSVSHFGQWYAVGANKDDDNGQNSGSVYVYKFEDSEIIDEFKITPDDGDFNEYFGKTLSVSDEWLIVSAIYDNENGEKSGSVYIFKYDGSIWNQFDKIYPDDGAPYDRFGYSVDLHDDRFVVGSVYDDDLGENSGSAYIYQFDGTIWSLEKKINSNSQQEDAHFGKSVAIFYDIVAIGAYAEDTDLQNAGSATIFRLINNEWIEIQKIFSPNSNSYDFFGNDLDIYDDKLVIGSYYADNIYDNSGSVFLYELNYGIFDLVLELNAYDSYLNDNFGQSVSIYSNYVAVGAMDDDNGTNSGAVYVYKINDDWTYDEIKLYPNDLQQYDEFGSSVSIFDYKLIVGSSLDDDLGNDAGSVYILDFAECNDITACNYDTSSQNLLHDSQICIFPENGFECDGSCIYEIDSCNICNGGGSNGDVDLNGIINITDIILILGYMLGDNDINICIANINNDNVVNITDLIILIDNILNF